MQIARCETCSGSKALEMQDRQRHKETVQNIMLSHMKLQNDSMIF